MKTNLLIWSAKTDEVICFAAFSFFFHWRVDVCKEQKGDATKVSGRVWDVLVVTFSVFWIPRPQSLLRHWMQALLGWNTYHISLFSVFTAGTNQKCYLCKNTSFLSVSKLQSNRSSLFCGSFEKVVQYLSKCVQEAELLNLKLFYYNLNTHFVFWANLLAGKVTKWK